MTSTQGFLSTITSSDQITKLLDKSDKLENSSVKSHGQAKLLRVATLAATIHNNKLVVDNKTFDVETACAYARALFNRLDYGAHAGEFPILDDEQVKEWTSHLLSRLHPYKYNGVAVPGEKVTRKKALKELNPQKDKAPRPELIDALERIDRARKATKEALAIACLYVHRDRDGTLLDQFSETSGLIVHDADVLPVELNDNNQRLFYEPTRSDGDDLVYIPPVASAHVMVEGKRSAGLAGVSKKMFRVTLESFRKAWSFPGKDEAPAKDMLTDVLRKTAQWLTTDLIGHMTEAQQEALREARNAIAKFDAAATDAENMSKNNKKMSNG